MIFPFLATVPNIYHTHHLSREISLADELGGGGMSSGPSSLALLRCEYLRDTDSPDSERLLTDADSGHSTGRNIQEN